MSAERMSKHLIIKFASNPSQESDGCAIDERLSSGGSRADKRNSE
jgi:hypothetical protein